MRLLTALFVVAMAACSNAATPGPARPIADPIAMRESSPSTGAPTSKHAVATLAAYEQARALLAADEMGGLGAVAQQLEKAATAAATDASPTAAPHLKGIASNAPALAAAADLNAARLAFAELSRHLIALLATDKALADGQHVFECPMTKGYKKWVQPSEDLENPYMGKRMLTCGGASTLD